MSNDTDIDIEEHDLLEHPTLRGVFPDLSVVKQEVDYHDDEAEHQLDDEPWPEKRSLPPHDSDEPEEPTQQYGVDETWLDNTVQPNDPDDDKSNDTLILEPDKLAEKPDSTTDLVVDTVHLSPSDSPLVTSSQSIVPSPATPESDELDNKDEVEEDVFEDRCFKSYVSLQDWGPYLENSKCYCAQCEILFATENAIAYHNMTDHSYLEEVSVPHCDDYQESKRYVYGSKQENSIHQCDKCQAKFTRFYSLKKHKVVIHGEMLGETKHPDHGVPQPKSLAPKVVNVQSVATVATSVTKANKPTDSKHLCQVCNTTLPTKEELIAHLYDHVTSQHKCEFCNALFPQKIQLEKHLFTHVKDRHSSSSSAREGGISNSTSATSVVTEPSSSSNLNPRNEVLPNAYQGRYSLQLPYMLKCHICSTCFTNGQFYTVHMLKFHQKRVTSIPERARVSKLHCQPCNLTFSNIRIYNAHVRNGHLYRKCNLCKIKFRGSLILHNKECSGRVTKTKSVPSPMKDKPQPSKNVLKVGTKIPNARNTGVKLTDSHLKVQFVYKCKVCNETFPTYKASWRHKEKRHPGAWKVIVRDTQKLILKKTATLKPKELERTPKTKKSTDRRTKHILNVILQCHKCDLAFPTWGGANNHASRGCRKVLSLTFTCKICHLKFYMKNKTSHAMQHRHGEKLTIVKLNEYERNSHRTLHQCVTCQVYISSKQAICDHLSSDHIATDYQECTECGYRICGSDVVHTRHMKAHNELNLSKSDFIIFRYSHTNETQETAGVSEEAVSMSKAEEEQSLEGMEMTSEMLKLIQCETCKRHMIRKAAGHKNKMCRFARSYICPKCGMSFTSKSVVRHMLLHKHSTKPLTFRDFDVTNYSGKKVTLDVATIVRSLHKCKCGVVSHSESDLNSHKRKYGTTKCNLEESVKCKICNVAYLKKSYTWHLMLHKRSTVPKLPKSSGPSENNSSVAEEGPGDVLSFVRCDKCHVHISNRKQSIWKHRAYACVMKRHVCLKCGLIVPKKSQSYHDEIHKKSSIPFTMKDVEILRMSDMKPVDKEVCGYPHCKRCGLRLDADTNQHLRYRCISDETPKTHCETCGLTFADNVYKLHLPYYGCDEAPQTNSKKRKASEMDDSAEITKLISNYNRLDQAWSQLYQCTECEVLVDSYDEVVKHCEHHKSPSYEVAAFVCHVCDLNFDYISFQRHKEQHFTRPGIERSCFEVLEFQPSKYKTASWQLYLNAFTGNKISYKLKQEGPEQHTLYQCAKCKNVCTGKIAAYEHTTNESNCSASSQVCKECGLTIQLKSIPDHEKYHQTNPYLTSSSFRIFWFIREVATVNEPTEDETVTVSDSAKPILYKCAQCHIHYPSRATAIGHRHMLKGKPLRVTHIPCTNCGLTFTNKSIKRHNIMHHIQAKYQRADFLIKIVKAGVQPKQVIPQSQSNFVPQNHVAARKNKIIVRKNQVVIRKNLSEKRANGNVRNKLVLGIPAKRLNPVSLGLPYKPVKKLSPTLYKCAHCDLHFLAYSTVLGHAMYDHIRGIASKVKVCPTCNLTFRHASYTKHDLEHHQKANYKAEDFDIFVISSDKTFKVIPCRASANSTILESGSDQSIAVKTVNRKTSKVQLYRCSSCFAHFLSETAIKKHFSLKLHSTADNIECAICRYHFKHRSLRQHQYIHHKLRNVSRDDFRVVVKTPQVQSVVFKCTDCVICFVTLKTIAIHGTNHIGREASELKQCEICKLYFTNFSLKKHMNYHHPNGEDGTFKIVEVKPGEVTNAIIRKYKDSLMKGSTEDKVSANGAYENVEFLDEDIESVNQEHPV